MVDCIDIKIDEGIPIKHIQIRSVEPNCCTGQYTLVTYGPGLPTYY